jgi:cation diffusion facilitator CzcD-associated flavoprotein CzcO
MRAGPALAGADIGRGQQRMTAEQREQFDIVVAGCGLGGIYALHAFSQRGYKVIGVEQANQLGGVWHLNRYPGSRVDVEPIIYSYYFSDDLYRDWRWRDRYPTSGELRAYLNHVADMLDVRRLMRFNAGVIGAQWRPDVKRWDVDTADGRKLTCRFLVMATGNLTEPRDPNIPGIGNFKGPIYKTSRWPEVHEPLAGKRVGVIGTGSSGVQCIPVIAEEAKHLYVFQRSAHYAIPAHNRTLDYSTFDHVTERKKLLDAIENMQAGDTLTPALGRSKKAGEYTREGQLERLEQFWAVGGQNLLMVFADQSYDEGAAEVVSNFVRDKIRQKVKDPKLAEKLCPTYPLGPKRIANEIDYYETYNRDNVTLVDIKDDPIVDMTANGIKTATSFYELDVIVLALGFKAFTGALDNANIRNEHGETPTARWEKRPQTFLGLMTPGFPNLFLLTGPGSPSVAGNLYQLNEYHVEWVNDCLKYMQDHGYAIVEPTEDAAMRWTDHVAALGAKSLRAKYANYMVHINPDGTRFAIPYRGSMNTYYKEATAVAAGGYEGMTFRAA